MKLPVSAGPALLATLILPQAVQAGDFDSLQLNGNAERIEAGTTLRLTRAEQGRAGTAFTIEPVAVTAGTAFGTHFTFLIMGGTAADGLTFTVQNDDGGAFALGSGGGNLAYQGIRNSLAVAFDTYDNGWNADPLGQNVAIVRNGDVESGPSALLGSGPYLRGAVRHAWIDYTPAHGGRVDVFYSDVDTKPLDPLLTATGYSLLDITGGQMYVGFTGATGGSTDDHLVLSWEFSVMSVPEPATVGLTALGLGVIAWSARRRR